LNLLAGPWAGEFGWQVSAWIPYLRAISHLYSKIVVVCRPGDWYLYKDFADDYIYHNPKGNPDMWYARRFPTKKPKMPKFIEKLYPFGRNHHGYEIIKPSKKSCIHGLRKFFKYGEGESTFYNAFDIVIHARAEDKYGQSDRNWPIDKYERLLRHLRKDSLVKVCSVGTKAYHIPGTEDLRNIALSELCNIMNHSKMTIGPSSGVMHLSHLCGCPILVWTYNKWEKGIKATNKERYKKIWRAWDSPIKVIDEYGWQPSVRAVEKEVRKLL